MLDTEAATRFPRSRPYPQGQRFWGARWHTHANLHLVVVGIPKMSNVASTLSPQQVPQDCFKISDVCPRSRSQLQWQSETLIHTYYSWVVHIPKMVSVASMIRTCVRHNYLQADRWTAAHVLQSNLL